MVFHLMSHCSGLITSRSSFVDRSWLCPFCCFLCLEACFESWKLIWLSFPYSRIVISSSMKYSLVLQIFLFVSSEKHLPVGVFGPNLDFYSHVWWKFACNMNSNKPHVILYCWVSLLRSVTDQRKQHLHIMKNTYWYMVFSHIAGYQYPIWEILS